MKIPEEVEQTLLLGRSASVRHYSRIFQEVLSGRFERIEVKKLLLLLARKGGDSPEIRGCLTALRKAEHFRRVPVPHLMDVCGTGGDGLGTFNISTVCAFVIAAAGGYVAKHGNRSASSRVGSSDLMEALGVRIDVPFHSMLKALRTCHLGYFHAPQYHPSFRHVQKVRRELGIPTFFNSLGPLVNPIKLDYQMVGVSCSEWVEPAARGLKQLGRKRAAVVRSEDGLDELSTCEESDIFYIEGTRFEKFRLNPRKLGFARARIKDYEGGDLRTNCEIALGILTGRIRGGKQDIVVLNSGFALWLCGISASISDGIDKSRRMILRGEGVGVLESLRRMTNRK